MNLSDIAILNIHSADYRCVVIEIKWLLNFLENINLTEKSGTL